MDFIAAIRRLDEFFDGRDVSWAVVGGMALAAHGAGRLTHDLDIVTERRVQSELIDALERRGYETLYRSEGYSNHAHPRPEGGRIDVVYVDAGTATRIFADSVRLELFPEVFARVPHPEHLVAMKVLAAKNDPSRRQQEIADIIALMRATGIDPEVVRPYFETHEQLDSWKRVRESL